jgi:fido (protein-threonine AMPylation protein)
MSRSVMLTEKHQTGYHNGVPGPSWDDDVVSTRATKNLRELALSIPAESIQSRAMPTASIARDWHRSMFEGVEEPDEAYRGGFRGDPHPALVDYETTIGGLPTPRAASVGAGIRKLIVELQDQITWLDAVETLEDPTVLDPDFVSKVLELAAWLHCEWVRIHPFANGNGRTARMWVLWLCARYGLPELLALRPRPSDTGYDSATQLGTISETGLFLQYLLVRYNKVSGG